MLSSIHTASDFFCCTYMNVLGYTLEEVTVEIVYGLTVGNFLGDILLPVTKKGIVETVIV